MIIKKNKLHFKIKWKSFFHITYMFILLGLGILIQKFGIIGNFIVPIFSLESQNYIEKHKRTFESYVSSFPGEELILDIPFVNYQKLEYQRQKALKKGLLVSDNNDYVGAKLSVNGISNSIDIRLKGDEVDKKKMN